MESSSLCWRSPLYQEYRLSCYSPVVSFDTVCLMVVFALLNNWHMESINFVLAYPQAPIKTDIFMQPPKVPPNFTIPDLPNFADRFLKVYKLLKNLYGLKDAGKTWADFLNTGLLARGWKPSEVDSCLYTKNGIILILYVDNRISHWCSWSPVSPTRQEFLGSNPARCIFFHLKRSNPT